MQSYIFIYSDNENSFSGVSLKDDCSFNIELKGLTKKIIVCFFCIVLFIFVVFTNFISLWVIAALSFIVYD